MIESLPSLYFSEVTKAEDDTEDDDEDTLLNEKTPPRVTQDACINCTKKAPLSSDSPSIETYSPQLDYSLYSPSVNYPLSTLSDALPVNSSCPAARNPTLVSYNNNKHTSHQFNSSSSTSTKMDVVRPTPQPTQSTSRFMNALHRLRSVNSSNKGDNSVGPADIKLVPSKSSLADKIKSKFQQQLKTNTRSSLDSSVSVTRSSSLSNWSSRLSKAATPQRRNIVSCSEEDLSKTIAEKKKQAAFSLTKSISSHRLYHHQQEARNTSRPRQQPLRTTLVANHHVPKRPPVITTTNKIKKGVRFTKLVSVRETFSKTDYDRLSDPDAVCTRLTPMIAQQIKDELNYYKLHEMQVHEQSRENTHFFI